MAINLQSFLINNIPNKFQNCVGFSTESILNLGDSNENELSLKFRINNIDLKSITYKFILFNENGEYSTDTRFRFTSIINNVQTRLTQELIGNENIKVLNNVIYNVNENLSEFELKIENLENKSCYLGLESLILKTGHTDIWITFTGPFSNRTAQSIRCIEVEVKDGESPVSFSKNPLSNFDKDADSVEGRAYFRKDGIYVDGYQYGVNTTAKENKQGLVKVSKSSFDLEYDEEGNPVGIIAPNTEGVAATPELVFNTLATSKNYTDEVIAPIEEHVNQIQATLDGINAPLVMNIETNNGELETFGEELTFSNDFQKKDNKLYINWIEIT